jgi:predicted dehydrogenase
LQKQAAAALEKEFGFAPAKLKEIVLQEAIGDCFHIRFRVREHYYNYHYGKIERTNERGQPL